MNCKTNNLPTYNLEALEMNAKLNPIETLFEMQKMILAQQEFIIQNINIPECIDVKFIYNKLDISKSKIYDSPWLLPNFGISDYTSGKKRWKWETWVSWNNRDEATRKKEWDLLPHKTKEQIRNVEN